MVLAPPPDPSSRTMPPGAGIRARLSTESATMAPAQRRLASYLLEHLSSAPDLGITDLAEEAGVSVGTISLLCRRLGLRGYQDLRLGLAREAVSLSASGRGGYGRTRRRDAPDPSRPPSTASSAPAPRRSPRPRGSSTEAALRGPSTSSRELGASEWVGVGSAGLVAAEGALKLRKLGVDSVAHVRRPPAGDVGRGAGRPGRAHRRLPQRPHHRRRGQRPGRAGRGAQRRRHHGRGGSPLARLAHVVLGTVSYDTGFQVEPMASTLAQLAIVQLLFLAYLERGR